jgi:hypothetical protein
VKIKTRYLLPFSLPALAILSSCVAPPPPPVVEEVPVVKPTHYRVLAMESPALGFEGRDADAGMTVPAALTAAGGWSPGAWFASEMERQIQLSGIAVSKATEPTLIAAQPRAAPPEAGDAWLESIRRWYESPEESVDYLTIAPDFVTHVIEVGIANYMIEDQVLYLSLLTRVINIETGQVLRRARVFSTTNMHPEQAFTNDAGQFKEVFSKTGEQLVRKSLSQVGLIQ